MKFSIDFDGDQQINRTLVRVSDRASDCRHFFDYLADFLADRNRENFEAEGALGGRKWKALSPKYARWKARHYPGRKILVRSGALRRDVTRRPFGIEQITKHGMVIGTPLPYASVHQHGVMGQRNGFTQQVGRSGGGGGFPRRPPFELSQKTRGQVTKMLQRYLRTGEIGPP